MTRRMLLVAAAIHVVFAAVLFANVYVATRDISRAFLAIFVAAACGLPARARIRNLMNDRPRSRWQVQLLELPYFVHLCACVGMAAPALLCLLAATMSTPAAARTWVHAAAYTYLGGVLLSLWGIYVRRYWFSVARQDIFLADLPAAFEGYRIAHLSDLHIGALTPKHWADRWVNATLAEKPDLIVVTGDLVTNGTDFHQDIADALSPLRATDGVVVTMGNHDYFGDGEPLMSMLQANGLQVLRNSGLRLARGAATIFLGCADDTYTKRANVADALAERRSGECALLLAHDPELFADAVAAQVALTLSGHTHGGQVAMPFVGRGISLSHLAHAFHVGLYQQANSQLYVHPGLGTTGPPIRLGTVPTVAIHRLRRAPNQSPSLSPLAAR